MKYIKKFELFEAVILPSGVMQGNKGYFEDFKSFVKYGEKNGFDVVKYDEFYGSLSDADKKTAPPNGRVPFFALFNPVRKKPMFVVCVKVEDILDMIPNFKNVVDDIIGHEKVHASQVQRKKVEYILPNPTIKKEYFSNKEEVMAFSFSIAKELFDICDNIKDAFNELDKGRKPGQFRHLWSDIKGSCDEKTIKRYRKYIYQYLEKMYNRSGWDMKRNRYLLDPNTDDVNTNVNRNNLRSTVNRVRNNSPEE